MKNAVLVNNEVKAAIEEVVDGFVMKTESLKDIQRDNVHYVCNREVLMSTILRLLIDNRCGIEDQTKVVKQLEATLKDHYYGAISSDEFKDKINELFESNVEPIALSDQDEIQSEIAHPDYNKANIMDKLKDRVSNTQVALINSCKTELDELISTLDRFNNIESTEVVTTTIDTMLPEYIIGLCEDEQEVLKTTLCEYKMWLEAKMSLSEEGKLGDHNILGALTNIVYTLHQLILFANKFTDATSAIDINKQTANCIKPISEAINLGDVTALATDLIHENPFIVNDMILSTSLCVDLIINILSNIKSSLTIVSNAGINLVVFSKMITVCTTLNNYILDNVDLGYEE